MELRLSVVATTSILIALCAFEQPVNQPVTQDSFTDSVEYTIIPYDKGKWVFEKKVRPATLTDEDIQRIDTLLKEAVAKYNPSRQHDFDSISKTWPEAQLRHFIIMLERYKRQYVPVTNAKGEKEVFVNCTCNARNGEWKYRLITPRDGGNCYFNLMINLSKGIWYDFSVNGEA